MVIAGCRYGVKPVEGINALKKHLNLPHNEAKAIIEKALDGEAVRVDYDLVLLEDLQEFGFIVK
jgi:hypothetical protein